MSGYNIGRNAPDHQTGWAPMRQEIDHADSQEGACSIAKRLCKRDGVLVFTLLFVWFFAHEGLL